MRHFQAKAREVHLLLHDVRGSRRLKAPAQKYGIVRKQRQRYYRDASLDRSLRRQLTIHTDAECQPRELGVEGMNNRRRNWSISLYRSLCQSLSNALLTFRQTAKEYRL
ncbi:hypothetical protein J6590_043703 [Homalodisca vitripennis]|nr:hypothetical protein J6590_043703 [Homalodisca vitripennis]